MTVLWFSLAVVTALLGAGLIFLDKWLHARVANAGSGVEQPQAAEPRQDVWPEPERRAPVLIEEIEEEGGPATGEIPVWSGPPISPAPPLAPQPSPDPQALVEPPADVEQPPVAHQAPVFEQPPVAQQPGGPVHYENHSHVYNGPVYNGPVYNGPVYIETAHTENLHGQDVPAALPGRRKGIFDRLVKAERQKRQQWANERGFQYQSSDSALVHRWRRGVFAVRNARSARAVVRAETDIGILEFFDVDDLVAIAALHTEHPSSVLVELRAGWSGPPVVPDVTRVGELGGYEVYSSEVGAGQRFLWDPRLEGFIARLPQFIRVLWNEGPWVLAELPLDIPDDDLDTAAVVVRELADLLRVLPPELDPEPVDRQGFDPGAPQGQLQRWAGQA